MEAIEAAKSGNPDALRYALDQEEPFSWDDIMRGAIGSGSLDCVKVLYDKGYEQHRSEDPDLHPAIFAIWLGPLEILRFVVNCSGHPEADLLDSRDAVQGGVEMLQYVQELGCVLDDEGATWAAAAKGDLEALRYLRMSGVEWDLATLPTALRADSLPCLEYAHMHGCPQAPEDLWEDDLGGVVPSLPVLRYACEQMDPAFAANSLKYTAFKLEEECGHWGPENQPDWPVVLYLGRKLGTALPKALAEAITSRKERARALAGAFWKADKWQRAEEARLLHREAAGKRQRTSGGEENGEVGHEDAEQMATWEAMARVPKELRERIAGEANLITL
jgi:hypothetical protein